METNEFIQRLFTDASLDAIELASDVERILAEQVVFLRDHLATSRKDAVVGAHEVIRELYCRLEDKDRQIGDLREEVRFLRARLTASGG
jgi:hypothetical protein